MSQVGRVEWSVCRKSCLRGRMRYSRWFVTVRRAHVPARVRDQGLRGDVQPIPWLLASSTKNPIVAGTRRSSIVAIQSTTFTSIFGPTDDMAALNSFSVTMISGNRMATLSKSQQRERSDPGCRSVCEREDNLGNRACLLRPSVTPLRGSGSCTVRAGMVRVCAVSSLRKLSSGGLTATPTVALPGSCR
ncbi:hypothetical protein HD554DRAFT_1165066 [Boletus coccyginus]|nr:hypothetical protein HD554DRAFT_1165066 [Boletus coccyginus]